MSDDQMADERRAHTRGQRARPILLLAAAATAAVAATAGVAAWAAHSAGGNSSASCVASQLTVVPSRVAAGTVSTVTVVGRYYFSDCPDTVALGQTPAAPSGNQPVRLTVLGPDGSTISAFQLVSGPLGSFRQAIRLPALRAGSVTIRDEAGVTARLRVVGSG